MQRLRRAALGALLVAAGLGVQASPAHAEPDAVQCTVSGAVTLSPGIRLVPGQNSWNFASIAIVCLGASDDAGTWNLYATGSSTIPETCAEGTGRGTFTGGTAPEGAVTGGGLTYMRMGTTLAVEGTVVTTDDAHHFTAELVFLPLAGQNCDLTQGITGATVTGFATMHDVVPDPDTAYCPGNVLSGSGTWTPGGVTIVPTNQSYTMTVSGYCDGLGDEAGNYTFTLSGTSFEACTAGTGTATVTGAGPEGGITGTASWYKGGIHYYIQGSFTSAGESHTLGLWLDHTGGCPYTTSPLIGHGIVIDV